MHAGRLRAARALGARARRGSGGGNGRGAAWERARRGARAGAARRESRRGAAREQARRSGGGRAQTLLSVTNLYPVGGLVSSPRVCLIIAAASQMGGAECTQ